MWKEIAAVNGNFWFAFSGQLAGPGRQQKVGGHQNGKIFNVNENYQCESNFSMWKKIAKVKGNCQCEWKLPNWRLRNWPLERGCSSLLFFLSNALPSKKCRCLPVLCVRTRPTSSPFPREEEEMFNVRIAWSCGEPLTTASPRRPAVARQEDLRRSEISNYNFRVWLYTWPTEPLTLLRQ